MQPEENKNVTRRFLKEVFEGGNLELVDELFAPDYVLHDPFVPEEVRGPEGIKQFVSMYRNAFPDAHITIEDLLAEGDKVVVRWTARGTHQGELMGVPPSGNRVEISGIAIYRVSGGKIEETWSSYDALGIMQQIGAVPEQGG